MIFTRAIACAFGVISATSLAAQDKLTNASAEFMFKGERVSIVLDDAKGASQATPFAGATADCGEACLGPVQIAPGVTALGEREVLSFLTNQVVAETGLLVDARETQDRALGYIPGSVSLPAYTLSAQNAYQTDILLALGAKPQGTSFDFSQARDLLVFDVGPAANDAGLLVQNLLDVGYPAQKISYYRGGMLMWAALGLSITEGS